MSSGFIRVERSFRYSVLEAEEHTHLLVYLLHGYGQLAEYFIRKAEGIERKNVTFVAPEGMHRFYLNGTSGRVGASWMTREARELDIAENTENLDRLHNHLSVVYQPKKVLLIGFSQGGATAARWLANGQSPFDAFVSWASVFPPDVAFPETGFAPAVPCYFVIGNDDPYFSADARDEAISAYEQLGFRILRFDGKHDLDKTVITSLISSL